MAPNGISVQFDGMAGTSRWVRHEIGTAASQRLRRTVEVSWNTFTVRLANGRSEWLIAIDRNGEI